MQASTLLDRAKANEIEGKGREGMGWDVFTQEGMKNGLLILSDLSKDELIIFNHFLNSSVNVRHVHGSFESVTFGPEEGGAKHDGQVG